MKNEGDAVILYCKSTVTSSNITAEFFKKMAISWRTDQQET